MTASKMTLIADRAHKLRQLVEREMRRPDAQSWRLMRLKALQLKVQSRLADLLLPQHLYLRPVPIHACSQTHAGLRAHAPSAL